MKDFIVRVVGANGKTAGTAFFISPTRLVTCAHVVQTAQSGPGGELTVYPRGSAEPLTVRVLADQWSGPNSTDVAGLEVVGELKSNSFAQLCAWQLVQNKEVETFGHPVVSPNEGLLGRALVLGPIMLEGQDLLQIQSKEIIHGYSGAPVWDLNNGFVAGMVVSLVSQQAALQGRHEETAFLVPSSIVRKICKAELSLDSPYRGLQVFERSHADLYFGRDEAIKELMLRLNSSEMVFVAGASGSGKSSLIRAGLEHGFKRDLAIGMDREHQVFFVAGRTPFFNLTTALAPQFGVARLEAVLRVKPGILHRGGDTVEAALLDRRPEDIAADIASLYGAQRPLLVIDQFERIFTECMNKPVRTLFIDTLASCASHGFKVLLAIKMDYYDTLVSHDTVARYGKPGTLLLQQMTEQELKQAIELPAERVGRWFDPLATAGLIKDVLGRPGDLPLLQFALDELWNRDAASGVLTFKSYEEIGSRESGTGMRGARGAIIKRAEAVWNSFVARGAGDLAKRVFLSLVLVSERKGDGKIVLDASRRALLSEFNDEVLVVAKELSESFLVTTGEDPFSGQPTIEVAHEALIRNWPKLRQWVEEHEGFLRWYTQELAPQMQRWLDRSRAPGYLLPTNELPDAKKWLSESGGLLSGTPAEYIRKSEQALLDAHQAKRKRRLNIILWGGLGAFSIVWLIVIMVVHQRLTSLNATNQQAASYVQGAISDLAHDDYDAAEVLLAESLILSDQPATREALLRAKGGGANGLKLPWAMVNVVSVASDAAYVVTHEKDAHRFSVHDKSGKVVFEVDAPDYSQQADAASTIAISPSGRYLAYAKQDGSLDVRELATNHAVAAATKVAKPAWPCPALNPQTSAQIVDDPKSKISAIAFSADERYLAWGYRSGYVQVDDLGKQTGVRFCAHRQSVHGIAFNSKDGLLATVGADRAVRIWAWLGKPFSGTELGHHEDYANYVTFSPDDSEIATAGGDGAIKVWDVKLNHLLNTFVGHLGGVNGVAFHPKVGLIASVGADRTVRLWDLAIGKQIVKLNGSSSDFPVVAFLANGRIVLSGGESGTTKEWEVGRKREGFTLYAPAPIAAVAYHPDGKRVASGDHDGGVTVWNLEDGSASSLPKRHRGVVWEAVFSHDGVLATAGADGFVRTWDIEKMAIKLEIPASAGEIYALAFSPDGKYLASGEYLGSAESGLTIWDAKTGAKISRIPHPGGSVWNILFSADAKYLVIAAEVVEVWNIQDIAHPLPMSSSRDPKAPPSDDEQLYGLALDSSQKHVAYAGATHVLQMRSFPGLKPIRKFNPDAHLGPINSVAFSNDGQRIITGSSDDTIRLWDVKSEASVVLRGHERPVFMVAVDPSGKHLATAGIDQRIHIWSFDGIDHVLKSPPETLKQEVSADSCLQLPPDGKSLEPHSIECVGSDSGGAPGP